MTQIVRLNDTSDHNGKMVQASGQFKVNDINVCIDGDYHECPIEGHGRTHVKSINTLESNGKSVIRVGDKADCGAIINSGSSDTFTN